MSVSSHFRPPVPTPRAKPPGPLQLLAVLRRNVLEVWSEADFEIPIQIRKTIVDRRALVSDPVGIRHVFLENARNYPKNELQLRLLRPAVGAGLLTSNGDNWKRQRRILAPLFSPKQVEAFAAAKERVVAQSAERLMQKPAGAIVDLSEEMGRLTLEILEHTLFGQGLGRDPSEFQHAITRYFDTLGQLDLFDMLGLPSFVPRLNRLRGRTTLGFAERVVNDMISARRRLLASGEAAPQDMLTLLLQAQGSDGPSVSASEVRDNIVTFIGAGHETTANALTWTLYTLSQAADWRARVEAEIDENVSRGAPVTELAITQAVLEESMRLYPPVSMMSRLALQDDTVAGVHIAAGTIVTVAPYVLHRHRTLWRDADLFDPERFLGANRDAIDRYAYLPFGVGPRVCIGMGFAMTEMLLILRHLLSRFRFDLVPGHLVEPQVRLTMRPAHGMKMQVTTR
jgi:cytochrome P450